MARPRLPLLPRFMKYVQVDPVTGCWLWTSTISKRWGYGRFWNDGKQVHAHRMAYMLFKGPIPEGLDIDHTCHNADKACAGGATCPHRCCVNPDHLEVVTGAENTRRGRSANRRKTSCAQGHPYTKENVYLYTTKSGVKQRMCKECNRIRSRSNWKKKAAAARADTLLSI